MRGISLILVTMATLLAPLSVPSHAVAADARIRSFEFSCVTPDGRTLKPKFGDIDGVFYTDLPGQRDQCLETIKRKISLCRENTNFESNAKNREFAGCLPIFKEQAKNCVGHFEFERGKCGAGGPGADDTAASGKKDKQGQEAEPEDSYAVDPIDRVMEVAKRTNVRAGPGTGYDVLGTLEPGVGVRVTGEVRGRDWLRVDLREDGGAAFVYAPLLKEMEPAAPLKPFGSNWVVAENQPCQLWNPYFKPGEPVTWSGACVDGKASGEGRWVWRSSKGEVVFEGSMEAGKHHGHGTLTSSGGFSYEGGWRDGKRHGYGTVTFANGSRYEGGWRDDKPHGHGTTTSPKGNRYEGEWRDGERQRQRQ